MFENYVHGTHLLWDMVRAHGIELGGADWGIIQTSLSIMFTSSYRYGIRLGKKNSTGYGVSHTVRPLDTGLDLGGATWLTAFADDTDLIMLCYSVDSKDSLENVESKWVGEIADNCPGVKLVLVALKCDLRESGDAEDGTAEEASPREKKPTISYDAGLEVARRIHAVRYLECSAMRNRGVNEAFTEAARVALSVRKERDESKCTVM